MGPVLVIYSSLNIVKALTTVSLPSSCIGGQVSLQLSDQRAALPSEPRTKSPFLNHTLRIRRSRDRMEEVSEDNEGNWGEEHSSEGVQVWIG